MNVLFTLVLAMDGLIDVLEIGEQGVTTCHALVIVNCDNEDEDGFMCALIRGEESE